MKRFLRYSKNYIYFSQFDTSNLFHFPFSTFFEFGKCEKRKGKNMNREQKKFFRLKKKNFFKIFEGLLFGKKLKYSRHKLTK